MKTSDRVTKLRQRFAAKEIDAIFISQSENRYYLSNFDGTDGYLVITPKRAVVATDSRYTEQARQQSPDYEVFLIVGKMEDWFPRLVEGMGLKRLGFESGSVTFALHQQLAKIIKDKGLAFELVPVDGVVEPLRMVKNAQEIAFTMAAVEISDAALEHFRLTAHAGITELEAAWEIEKHMRESGSQALPFEVIVAAGPNSALPHHRPSERPIKEGEPIVIDIGAKVGYYASDLTRTICIGKPDETLKKVYGIVFDAQKAALDGIRAGMTGEQADLLARNVIQNAGYADNFGHGLGHGTGLNIHEGPRVSVRSTDILEDGMIFSV